MEHHKPGFDGTQAAGGQAYAFEAPPRAYTSGVAAQSTSSITLPSHILRIVAIVLTIISAVVMGVAKQTVTVFGVDNTTGIPFSGTFWTKSTYSAAFVYFVAANVAVCVYSVVSLAVSVASRAGGVLLPFTILDVVMVAVMFSCNGAAAATSVALEYGQHNLADWGKICDTVGGFCARVNAAIVLSMFASVVYVLLVVLAVVAFRRSHLLIN